MTLRLLLAGVVIPVRSATPSPARSLGPSAGGRRRQTTTVGRLRVWPFQDHLHRLDALAAYVVAGGHGAFVAAFRNRAETVLRRASSQVSNLAGEIAGPGSS
jgi:hypothetical protein